MYHDQFILQSLFIKTLQFEAGLQSSWKGYDHIAALTGQPVLMTSSSEIDVCHGPWHHIHMHKVPFGIKENAQGVPAM